MIRMNYDEGMAAVIRVTSFRCQTDRQTRQTHTHTGQPQRHLEELHSDAGEHKLQQGGDDHDVTYGPDGHKHTLDHVLRRRRRRKRKRERKRESSQLLDH